MEYHIKDFTNQIQDYIFYSTFYDFSGPNTGRVWATVGGTGQCLVLRATLVDVSIFIE